MNPSRNTATKWLSAIGYRLSAIGYRLIFSLLIAALPWQTQAKNFTFEEDEELCDVGIAAACFNLGVSYFKGQGVAKDLKKANQHFDKACRMRDAQGCFNLGNSYINGDGVVKSEQKAAQYYDKSMQDG